MCFVVTCWERADLLALVCGVFCEFVTFPLVSWVRCGTRLYRFLIFATLLTLKNYITLSRPRGRDNHGGVACLYRQSNQYILQRKSDLETDNLEAICVEIKTERNETFLIVVVYVPPNKVEQMTLLGKLIKEANKSYQNIIVTGDMNAKSTIWGNAEINGAGSILDGIIDEENLIVMNDMLPTYRNSHSVIDLFLVRAHMNRKIKYCQTLNHENVRSDHISVIMDLENGLEGGGD